MTYYVSSGTLNFTYSLTHLLSSLWFVAFSLPCGVIAECLQILLVQWFCKMVHDIVCELASYWWTFDWLFQSGRSWKCWWVRWKNWVFLHLPTCCVDSTTLSVRLMSVSMSLVILLADSLSLGSYNAAYSDCFFCELQILFLTYLQVSLHLTEDRLECCHVY